MSIAQRFIGRHDPGPAPDEQPAASLLDDDRDRRVAVLEATVAEQGERIERLTALVDWLQGKVEDLVDPERARQRHMARARERFQESLNAQHPRAMVLPVHRDDQEDERLRHQPWLARKKEAQS